MWLCVQCKPQQETKAETNLSRQGIDVYLPLESIKNKHRSKSSASKKPMFPGYLFIYANLEQQDLSVVRSTLGCIALLRHGVQPAVVPTVVIEGIQRAERALQERFESHLGLTPGAMYEILEPGFSGHAATFVALDSRERVRVLITLLNSKREVVVSRKSLGERRPSVL